MKARLVMDKKRIDPLTCYHDCLNGDKSITKMVICLRHIILDKQDKAYIKKHKLSLRDIIRYQVDTKHHHMTWVMYYKWNEKFGKNFFEW